MSKIKVETVVDRHFKKFVNKKWNGRAVYVVGTIGKLLQDIEGADGKWYNPLKGAIKELVDEAIDIGIAAGMALSTMTDEPFTSKTFKILQKGVSDGLKKEFDYE